MILGDVPVSLLSRMTRIDTFDIETLLQYARYIGEDRVVEILEEVQEFILLQPLDEDDTETDGIA